jgi:F0F1-type ATP synthase membrane subunit b/b'
LVLFSFILVAYIILRKTNHKIKDHNVKKSEIIEQYEQELKKILENTEENSIEDLLEKKKTFLNE